MWETSRFRGGNGNDGRNNSGNKRNRSNMRMKRVPAQLVANRGWGVPATIVPSRLILNDLGPKGVAVFGAAPLELGQIVTFSLELPRPIMVRGKVTYCALFETTSRIHSSPKFSYRLQIEFDFLNDGEAQAVLEYVEEIRRTDLSKAA